MLVKIGDTVFDSIETPIGVFLDESEQENFRIGFGETNFYWALNEEQLLEKTQDELEAIDRWAKDFVSTAESLYPAPDGDIGVNGSEYKEMDGLSQIQSVVNIYTKDQKLDLLSELIKIAQKAEPVASEGYRFLQEWEKEETNPFIKNAIAETFKSELGHNINGDAD